MHQSVPAVPIPLGNRRAFAHVVSPGGGTFAILSRPGGWANSLPPGDSQGIWHKCFRKMDEFTRRDEDFVKDWLVRQGLEKLVDVFKGKFLNFRDLFITCKHINISDKVNYILFITKQSRALT